MNNKKILKTNEAAAYLGVSRSSLASWARQGLLGSGLTPGGHYRFPLEELDAFAEKRGLVVQGEASGRRENFRILVIEDDESFRVFVREALEVFDGCELKEAADGMQGALLTGSWEPDLIILDIRMPNMNGIEFLKLLKGNPATADVKVIAATAFVSEEIRTEIQALGVDMLIEKPVRLARLVASMQKLLDLKLRPQ